MVDLFYHTVCNAVCLLQADVDVHLCLRQSQNVTFSNDGELIFSPPLESEKKGRRAKLSLHVLSDTTIAHRTPHSWRDKSARLMDCYFLVLPTVYKTHAGAAVSLDCRVTAVGGCCRSICVDVKGISCKIKLILYAPGPPQNLKQTAPQTVCRYLPLT